MHRCIGLVAALVLGACTQTESQIETTSSVAGPLEARFDHFRYAGTEPEGLPTPGQGEYRNPVLQGFYPDPSITRAGDRYYLVTSTFAYFPGLPVFESRDLVNWRQIGNVIDRPGMLDFDGLGLSRGVFAPTIEYHEGTFYVSNTCVDCGGNFVVTATDPSGPWSDPIWAPEVGGIDPSLFFDEDGKVYMINNDAPVGEPRYEGHRAIWIREVDPDTLQPVAEARVLLDGGVRPEENPIWIEGPHIYRVDGRYYLWAAEGGTAIDHSQVVLRADDVLGPYVPYEDNPVLTQRHLSADRPNPITSVGHADMVQDADGEWWATFLGVRPYEGDRYNTGRETFLMPVRWEDGWPVMLSGEEEVAYVHERPALPLDETNGLPMSGPFIVDVPFDEPLAPYWMMVRVPNTPWHEVEDGELVIRARSERLGEQRQPSVVVRRQQHRDAVAETTVSFAPVEPGDEAGLVAMQSDLYWYKLGVTVGDGSARRLVLRKRAGADDPLAGRIIADAPLPDDGDVGLRATARGAEYDFSYKNEVGAWTMLADSVDGTILSTQVAGGFVGATLGMYAERAPTE